MKKLSLLICVVLLSGCSWMKFWDNNSSTDTDSIEIEPAELVDFEPSEKLKKLWSNSSIGDLAVGIANLQPAIGNGAIYVADAKGRIAAINQSTGKTLWKKDLDIALTGGVGFGVNQVLVGSVKGQLYALSADTGAVLWQIKTSSEILAAPASNGNISVVQTPNGRLEAFDAETGEKRWDFEVDVPILTIRGTSTPIVTENMVLGAFSNGKAYGLNAETGAVLWEARVAAPSGRTELERIVDVDGKMLLQDDIVYAASFQGRLGAFSRGTGRALWYQDVSTHQSPAYSLSQVYITDADDKVNAYRSNSGQPLWGNDQLLYRQVTGPTPLSGYIAVSDAEGYLHLLSQIDGSFVARTKVDGSGVSAAMIAADDTLFVLDNSGGISAYRVE